MLKAAIVITTYNLEEYVGQALESVLNQKTNFKYKIIVADDCSTDKTFEIINNYKNKYPEKIEVLSSSKNQGSLVNSNRVFDGLQCEYFSFLDGDDYWINENRLQMQVDYLEEHPECMLCGANTHYLRDGMLKGLVVPSYKTGKSYSFKSLLNDTVPFVHTSAILVRNKIFINGLPTCYKNAENTFENCALRGEDFRRILHLELGDMYIMPDVFSVYRIHSRGVWQGSNESKRSIEGAIAANFYRKYFEGKYDGYFDYNAQRAYRNMMRVLVTEYGLLKEWQLSEQETLLFASLFNDISKEKNSKTNISKLKKFFLRTLIKFFI